jgi:hypothetical protein
MFFWPGQRTCGDDKVFAVGTNAKKVASPALGGIFSGGRASKIEIPAIMAAVPCRGTVNFAMEGPSHEYKPGSSQTI